MRIVLRIVTAPDGRRRLAYARTAHAPRGGTTVDGKTYPGGEFVPGPGGGGGASPSEGPREGKPEAGGKSSGSKRFVKAKATVGSMAPARREGEKKDAQVVLADGSPAPPHITAAMVPPAWRDVQVSLDPDADVLVKARDAKGRLKTVYNKGFDLQNAAAKFARVRDMRSQARLIRRQIQAGRQSADPAVREAADCAWLIQEQATRPGSERDTKAKKKAYGATTLRAEHVVKRPDGVHLEFTGKEGVWHDHRVRDPELARMLLGRAATAAERGGRLFHTSTEKLNHYIGGLDGGGFTAKDFRTLKATNLAVGAIHQLGLDCCVSPKEYKARVMEVARRVSRVLGNRPAQALESYIAPEVFSVWRPGP